MTTVVPSSPRTGGSPEPYPEFEAFYRDVVPKTTGILVLLGLSVQEAQDIVHEAMIHMLLKWPSQLAYTHPERTAYLHKVASSKARDALRRDRRLQRLLLKIWYEPVARQVVDAAGPCAAALLVQQLPARQRWVSVLSYHGFSAAEIADLMQISRSTVGSHLAHARKALRSGKDHGNDSR